MRFLIAFFLLCSVVNAQAQRIKDPELKAKVTQIFKTNCLECHGADFPQAELNLTDLDLVITDTHDSSKPYWVDATKPDQSRLYVAIATNQMPRGTDAKPLTAEDKALVLKWIQDETATDAEPVRPFVSESDVKFAVYNDLRSVPLAKVKGRRYFSLANLHNNSDVKEIDLETARQAISKLINSLSWELKIVKPVAIDSPRNIIYRIDLADYSWSPGKWETLISKYPYALFNNSVDEVNIANATGTRLPIIRGDWFIYFAARPPLYHELADIPDTIQKLEKTLKVDVKKNYLDGKVKRSGFRGGLNNPSGSGVSDHNRLIEVHTFDYGQYWKSFDFSSSVGIQDLFNLPLGPVDAIEDAGHFVFKEAGGEMIFNLPNGLQAYQLIDEKGKRIDSGPTNVVRDTSGRAVVNGVSCMGCHQSGMIRHQDEVRSYVEASPERFGPQIQNIRELYVLEDEMVKEFGKGEVRFKQALNDAGVTVNKEPVRWVTENFENPVDENKAASEVGLPLEEFKAKLNNTGSLQAFKKILEKGINRDGFIAIFCQITKDLDLGGTRCGELNIPRIGTLTLADGIYEGEIVDGKRHGQGKMTYSDNDRIYTGSWLFDKREGKGKTTFKDGTFHDGNYLNDIRNGKGILKEAYGTYDGDFKDGAVHGDVHATYSNGDEYRGQYEFAQRSGSGIYKFKDGKIYDGMWKNNKYEGKGKLTIPDGRLFEGDFKENELNGQGKFTGTDGSTYNGLWQNGKRHGEGTAFYADEGNKYFGNHVLGFRQEFGVMIFKEGHRYDGQWKAGQMEGEGKYEFAFGDWYKGKFVNNNFHGSSVYYTKEDNKERFGLWNDGVFVKWCRKACKE